MLPEISLNILDIAQNSIAADATWIEIKVEKDTSDHTLSVTITDNGKGMSQENLQRVTDPFYTTRTTRNVGLGIPFFKQEAECTGGTFSIHSEIGRGTCVKAVFVTSHIDCMPLGDVNATIHSLVTMNGTIDFYYEYRVDDASFHLDTREMREILGNVPFYQPEVSGFIREYLEENETEVNKNIRM